MIIIGIIFSILYYKLDTTDKKIFAGPVIAFIVFYSISFTLIDNPEINEYVFQYFRIKLTLRSYFFFFMTCSSFLIGIYLTRLYTQRESSIPRINYNLHKLQYLYYLFSLSALIGFTINLSRVIGNLSLLFTNPRVYEEVFGASSLINYLYFLNIPALLISIYLKNENYNIRYSRIINIFLVLISFFHGIKFTIFDTIGYPCVFYYLLKRKVNIRFIIFFLGVFIGIFILFSSFIRGAEDKSPLITLICYIIPNFYNLDFFIEFHPDTFGDFLSIFTPELIPSPTRGIGQRDTVTDLFIFNPAYNMSTSLYPLYMTLNFAGPLMYILIFAFQANIFKSRKYSLSLLFLSTYLEYCLVFAFYFYAYTKFKNVFYLILFVLIDYYCRKNSNHRVKKLT